MWLKSLRNILVFCNAKCGQGKTLERLNSKQLSCLNSRDLVFASCAVTVTVTLLFSKDNNMACNSESVDRDGVQSHVDNIVEVECLPWFSTAF